ncbi:alpha/beta fold hydrolase [Hespellia stercorisuis]|uniref:Pimeloyl-ACP methyl ester carboxylesterase n=1 Tax=Hespellia stercorisuis DSM 15480 TaxID=1121950 RepID=A0A1M6M7V9_9FIRM|nr:alpha/beta hydrolase [Hespellia stercorisuis]SHJ79470.1 Pimeloyl-ACP methyl ester carboxylesterase [Hespellia stercorisuis DSM 15480]
MNIHHFYIEKGQGEPLILLHGNRESSHYFVNQIEDFSRFFHVYAIDTRGHGRTPRGTQPFTIKQFADDLLRFMDEHQIAKANLLGFSDGANIAMVFAIDYPERVNLLVLNGANQSTHGVKRMIQVLIEIGYKIAKRFAGRSDVARRNAEMLELMVNELNVPVPALSGIKAKTLVIAGTNDLIKETHTRFIADHIPGSELIFIKGNHFIANKKSRAFNEAVLKFLTGEREIPCIRKKKSKAAYEMGAAINKN